MCKDHPKYQGKGKPRTLCAPCWGIYWDVHKGFCEHCGPINQETFKRDGTSWCAVCLEALD